MHFKRDAFAQIKPYISNKNIDFKNINQFEEILKTHFGKVDLVDKTKQKLYWLYQTNKDLELFLNTFLWLSKKAKIKIDNSQALDMLYKKMKDEFKNRLVTVKKAENLNDLILLLYNIDANMKKISK